MDSSANQPTYFFKCKYIIDSVCNILGMDVLSYSFPDPDESKEEVPFDCNNVMPGRKETYPPAFQPSKEEFGKIKAAYNHIKAEKDSRARAQGMPNSRIQLYKTFTNKWSTWRWWSALYNEMYKDMSKKTSMDKMTADLQLC
jgi:hypothetical protein